MKCWVKTEINKLSRSLSRDNSDQSMAHVIVRDIGLTIEIL